MLAILASIPFTYGLANAGILGALYGSGMTTALFVATWVMCQYRKLVTERNYLASSVLGMSKARSQIEIAYKVEQQTHSKTRTALDRTRDLNTKLLQEIHDLTHGTDAYVSKTRDEAMTLLQRRLANLNAEYHNKPAVYRSTVLTPEIANAEIKKKK